MKTRFPYLQFLGTWLLVFCATLGMVMTVLSEHQVSHQAVVARLSLAILMALPLLQVFITFLFFLPL